jgi:hypothetical protein
MEEGVIPYCFLKLLLNVGKSQNPDNSAISDIEYE